MGNPNLVPYETIVRATSGDPEAVEECSYTVKKQKLKTRDRPPAPHYSEPKKPKTKRQALWKCA